MSDEQQPTLEERMDDRRAVMDAVRSEHAAMFGVSDGGNLSILFTDIVGSTAHLERLGDEAWRALKGITGECRFATPSVSGPRRT